MVQSAFPAFDRPKIILQEFDLTQISAYAQGTIGFVNGEFRQGSLKPKYITGAIEQFQSNYGQYSDPTLSYDHDTCMAFLYGKSPMLVNRVVASDAAHAATHVLIDEDVTYGKRMLFLPADANVGYNQGYENGVSGITMIKFSTSLITGNTFSLSISDGTTTTPVSVVFATDHENTMLNIANAITTALSGFGSNGYAYAYKEPSSATAPSLTMVIVPPTNATVAFSGAAVASGATQPTVTQVNPSSSWLMTIFAENPGVWANDIGIKIEELHQGTRERYKLTFNAALVASNTINATINDVAITPVAYTTSSDATMAAFALALKNHAAIRDAWVETTPGGNANDRVIYLEAETPGENFLTLTNFVVSGGSSQPVISNQRTLTGKAAAGYFTIKVYTRTSPNVPIDVYTVTPYPYKNKQGDQIQAKLMNDDGARPSQYIRCVINPAVSNKAGYNPMLTTMMGETFQFRTTIAYLNGGADGSSVTTGSMISALGAFEDRIRYPLNLLLNAGRTAIEYQKALDSLARLRNDCTAILDMPTTRQHSSQSSREYRLYDLDIDSSHSAIYTPDILIADMQTDERRFIPPSGMVGAVYVYNDKVGAKWSAPAGFNRGQLRQALGFRKIYSFDDEELLHPIGVNCCVDRPGVGPVIMGEQTLQTELSALSSVHIRRLMNQLETSISDALEYILFEPHTESTRYAVVQLCESILEPIYRREGLYDYMIKCDAENNTPDVIDRDALAVDIYVKPVRAIKGILFRAFITRTGADFEIISEQHNIVV